MTFITYIFFKNLLLNIKINNSIIDILVFVKKLTFLYILCYKQFKFKQQILFINTILLFNNNIKLINLLTNSPYIQNKELISCITNNKILKQQLLLLKWIILLLNLINNKEIHLPFINLIKIFKKFLILKKTYWSLKNLKNPIYIILVSKVVTKNLLNTYKNFGKHLFCIFTQKSLVQLLKQSTTLTTTYIGFKILTEFIITANIQTKCNFIIQT